MRNNIYSFEVRQAEEAYRREEMKRASEEIAEDRSSPLIGWRCPGCGSKAYVSREDAQRCCLYPEIDPLPWQSIQPISFHLAELKYTGFIYDEMGAKITIDKDGNRRPYVEP